MSDLPTTELLTTERGSWTAIWRKGPDRHCRPISARYCPTAGIPDPTD